MNANRDCPGVPNRYSLSVGSIVTQPKSIAIVVVVLPDAVPGSSTPMPAVVISASVVSGAISEMARTVVVLPTPKPPATTILTGTGGACATRCGGGEACRPAVGIGPAWGIGMCCAGTRALPTARSWDCTKSTDHSHDGLGVGEVAGDDVNVELTRRAQVADEDPGHAEV